MRIGRLLLLLFAFAVGIAGAFAVAYFTFDAKPAAVVDKGPAIKILVAKLPIAVGEEISAEAVVFQDVPVCELPDGAITSFFRAYRRRPAYPISPGCPICEDLLIPKTVDSEETVKYIPAGSQIVVLEVEQVRLSRDSGDARLPITQVLSTEDSVDIRVVSRQDSQGEMIERKNNILRIYAPEKSEQKEEIGELILENIPLHDVRSSGQAIEGKQYQTVSLLLENDEVEKLYQAVRDGRLRIALHTEPEPEPIEEPKPESLQAVTESEPTVEAQPVVKALPMVEPEPEFHPEPKTVRLIAAPIEEQPFVAVEVSVANEETKTPISPTISFASPKVSTSIKNEPLIVAKSPVVEKTAPKSAVVGFAYAVEDRPSHDYSPFDVKTRSIEPDTEEPTVPKPLPARHRFQRN